VLGVKQHTLGAMIGREDSRDLPILPYEGYRDFRRPDQGKALVSAFANGLVCLVVFANEEFSTMENFWRSWLVMRCCGFA
jgi:hypothetical protein